MRIVLWVAAILSLGVGAPLNAQQTPVDPITGMLAKLVHKYRSLSSLSQTVNGKMTIKASGVNATATFSTVVKMARGNKLRVDSRVNFAGSLQTGKLVCDGETVWDVDHEGKKFVKRALEAVKKEEADLSDWLFDRAGVDLPILFFWDALPLPFEPLPDAALKQIKTTGLPVVKVNGRSLVAVLAPMDKMGKGGQQVKATLFIDPATTLVHRLTYVIGGVKSGAATIGVTIELNYSAITPKAELPDSAFRFEPPADYQEVAEAKGAFSRAFDGGGK